MKGKCRAVRRCHRVKARKRNRQGKGHQVLVSAG